MIHHSYECRSTDYSRVICDFIALPETEGADLSQQFANKLTSMCLLEAYISNTCGAKAKHFVSNILDQRVSEEASKLIMHERVKTEDGSSNQPNTPYRSDGMTTGASYHALGFFKKDNAYYLCDLNGHPDFSGTPFVQIFVAPTKEKLMKLANAVYACANAYLMPKESEWSDIFHLNSFEKWSFKKVYTIDELKLKGGVESAEEDHHSSVRLRLDSSQNEKPSYSSNGSYDLWNRLYGSGKRH